MAQEIDENREQISQKHIQVCFNVLGNQVWYQIIGTNVLSRKVILSTKHLEKNNELLLHIMPINKITSDTLKNERET